MENVTNNNDAQGTQDADVNATAAVHIEPKVPAPVAPALPDLAAMVGAAVKASFDEFKKQLDEEAAVKGNRPAWMNGNAPNVNKGVKTVEEVAAKAFDLYMREGDKSGYYEWNEAAREAAYKVGGDETKYTEAVKAAMNIGTTSQGGVLVPTGFANEMVSAINVGSIWRAHADVRTLDGVNPFKVPSLSNTTRAVKTAEAIAFDEAEPTLGELSFAPIKYTRLVKVSDELLLDSRFNVYSDVIVPDVANAFALGENEDFTVGDGSGDPQGVFVGASHGITAAGTNAITAEELINLEHSLPEQYRSRASFVMKDSTLQLVHKLRENGTTGNMLFQRSLTAGLPSTLLGYPLFTVPDAPAATTGLKAIAFGVFNPYFRIYDWGAMYFKRLEELYAGTGQVGFRWFKRYDSKVTLSAAIKYLIMA